MGISAVITYAREIWNGRSSQQAAEMAAYQGLKMGGAVFVSSVLAARRKHSFIRAFHQYRQIASQ